jgi:hypothetical protein
MTKISNLAVAAALVLATLVGTVASSNAAPDDQGHRLGYTRDQSVNGG